jgi:hypothetical protein
MLWIDLVMHSKLWIDLIMHSKSRPFDTPGSTLIRSSFRLCDLPQELRDRIYELSLQPQAVFYFSDLEHIDRLAQKPQIAELADDNAGEDLHSNDELLLLLDEEEGSEGDGADDESEDSFPEDWLGDPNREELAGDFNALLAFDAALVTPLLLVSRGINSEVNAFLRVNKAPYIKLCN